MANILGNVAGARLSNFAQAPGDTLANQRYKLTVDANRSQVLSQSVAAAQRASQAAAMPKGTGGVHTATKPMVANPHASAERRAQHDVDRVAREHQRMMGREHRVHPDRGNGRGRGGRRG